MRIAVDKLELEGELQTPRAAGGVVLFAHGSGSSRLSPRNNYVAAALRKAGFATLLFDLLSPAEAADRENVFDIGLLADRLTGATKWVCGRHEVRGLPLGYFGASTGAAAALVAAADEEIAAVVSRGGRPDLAEPALSKVKAPTLLIVGGNDDVVIELNREAYDRLRCVKQLTIVPGATHLFEEPGTLDEVVRLAIDWFKRHLAGDEPRKEKGSVR